ncbi:hypothetical protein HHI36_022313 [Cryptolaemus montrouzieri]|uniref:PiggyBac transposable element-derived protein domain-containing protein n=1 Tax=Cryptolaemus montrouzieri TaxID=559131 RepID=A0ABD2MZF1_9CUCU
MLGLLDKERRGQVHNLLDPSYVFANERDDVEYALLSIRQLINEFEGTTSDSVYKRVKFRLAHITSRVQRMPIDAEVVKRLENNDFLELDASSRKNSTQSGALLEPELYGIYDSKTSISNESSHGKQNPFDRPTPSVSAVESGSTKPITCWNCSKSGLRYSSCKEKRTGKFCYRCGCKDVTWYTCKKCSGNGNRRKSLFGKAAAPMILMLLELKHPNSPYVIHMDNLFTSLNLLAYSRKLGYSANGYFSVTIASTNDGIEQMRSVKRYCQKDERNAMVSHVKDLAACNNNMGGSDLMDQGIAN